MSKRVKGNRVKIINRNWSELGLPYPLKWRLDYRGAWNENILRPKAVEMLAESSKPRRRMNARCHRKRTKAACVTVLIGLALTGTMRSPAQVLITSQPQSNVLFPGAVASFTVAAESASPLSYQWRFNGSNLTGATASSLVISNLQWSDAGSYDVVVSDSLETTNSEVSVLSITPIAAWGSNQYGETNVPPNATNIVRIRADAIQSSAALNTDGNLVYWATRQSETDGLQTNLTDVIDFALGAAHTVALKSNGQLGTSEWAAFEYGRTNPPPGLTNLVAVAAGMSHDLALKADGTVVAWGENSYGQTNVPPWLTNVIAIDSFEFHNLALTAEGSVHGWGRNLSGETNVPVNLSNVVAIAAGRQHSVALRADGTVQVWGFAGFNFQNVPAAATNIVAIDAGAIFVMALRGDGAVIWWGADNILKPYLPAGLGNVSAIAAGENYALALVGEERNQPATPFTQPSLLPTGFQVSIPTRSGRVYRLEYKNSLSDSNWIALPLVAGTGKLRTLTDPSATNSQQRFYRVRQW